MNNINSIKTNLDANIYINLQQVFIEYRMQTIDAKCKEKMQQNKNTLYI